MDESSSIGDTPSDRAHVALEAAWEIEAISVMVIKYMDGDIESLAYTSLMRRTKRLACLIMSAISEADEVDMPKLQKMLNDDEVHHG
jgi:hypothetical protein